MEDYMATTRNGHQLIDFYDPDANTLDIRSNGLYPSNVLSNLCSNGFRFDGVLCGSMEGFLQSLKQQEKSKQLQICQMKGGNARKRSVTSWQTDQIVWWKGQAYDRQGPSKPCTSCRNTTICSSSPQPLGRTHQHGQIR